METAAAAAAGGEVEEEEEEEEEAEEEAALTSTRPVCREGCGRPLKVCLCRHLPEAPIPTATAVVVLQHPHELRRRLSTSPLLPRCLLRCSLLPGRRLLPGSHPSSTPSTAPPRPSAGYQIPRRAFPLPLRHHWRRGGGGGGAPRATVQGDVQGADRVRRDVEARGRDGASEPALSVLLRAAGVPRRRLQPELGGESMFESELALRKEPHRGCLTTVEAVARALAALEPHDGGEGPRAESALLSALRAMVALQMAHLSGKTVNRRPRLLKKKKNNNNKETEEEDPGAFSTPAVCSTK
ncbi:unnamed protein product [Spirodela intermedia]|uniref:tRNA-uridine aminocarboxypropyltransferase n=1 Tax=Spirodela intermedia TaxID=51605 RepID=A0A7I8J0E7_SPIIN|nr:unnamed protein product [Spirodela intermedia]CAA6663686.1 unnamed protein product [Spirodela intermedia]